MKTHKTEKQDAKPIPVDAYKVHTGYVYHYTHSGILLRQMG